MPPCTQITLLPRFSDEDLAALAELPSLHSPWLGREQPKKARDRVKYCAQGAGPSQLSLKEFDSANDATSILADAAT